MPLVAGADKAGLVAGKVVADVVADIEVLVGGKAETGPGAVGELRPTLAVALRGAGHFGNAVGDLGPGDDELRFAAFGFLGLVEGLEHGREIVAVNRLHLPADGLESGGGILTLRAVGHGVERHIVRVVDQDEVVEFLVSGERRGLHGHAFLHAAVAREADDVVVEDLMFRRVEARRGHLAGDGHAHRVGDALPQRTRGALHARGLAEFGMSRREAVQAAELHHVIDGDGVAAQVQPGVEEHAAMPGRENEAVAVRPARALGIVNQGVAEQHGADFSGAQRQAEMTRGARMHGVDGKSTGLIGGFGKKEGLKRHIIVPRTLGRRQWRGSRFC